MWGEDRRVEKSSVITDGHLSCLAGTLYILRANSSLTRHYFFHFANSTANVKKEKLGEVAYVCASQEAETGKDAGSRPAQTKS